MVSDLAIKRLIECNYSSRGGFKVCKITIHHAAGNISIDGFYTLFNNPKREASANYCIDIEGNIVCLVDEDYRAWTSSSEWNDQRAITIELANECGADGDWKISEKTENALIDLCADICTRYGIIPNFTAYPDGTFTFHYMYTATECPGKYIKDNIYNIIDKIRCKLDFNTLCNIPFDYCSRVEGGSWLGFVNRNADNYAGISNMYMTGLAITCKNGRFRYRVHLLNGGWLPYVFSNNFDFNDDNEGYAGFNDEPIDAVEIYYYTSDDYLSAYHQYLKAKYRVCSMYEKNYYEWQYDNETTKGQDGYAGKFGHPITKLQLILE